MKQNEPKNELLELLSQEAITVSVSGDTVTLVCESTEEATRLFLWIVDLVDQIEADDE